MLGNEVEGSSDAWRKKMSMLGVGCRCYMTKRRSMNGGFLSIVQEVCCVRFFCDVRARSSECFVKIL